MVSEKVITRDDLICFNGDLAKETVQFLILTSNRTLKK